jgi:hypothetical protein
MKDRRMEGRKEGTHEGRKGRKDAMKEGRMEVSK